MSFAAYLSLRQTVIFMASGTCGIGCTLAHALADQSASPGIGESAPVETLATALITGAITLLFGLVLAAITGVVGYLWGRRRAQEKDLLMVWRNAFDRASFRGSYMYHSDHEQFRSAISHTIKSISTGKLFDADGNELDRVEGVYHGPWQIKNPARRNVILDVRNRLQKIMRLSYGDPDFQAIDDERDMIISRLNEVWKRFGIETMVLPTQYKEPEDIQALVAELGEEQGPQ